MRIRNEVGSIVHLPGKPEHWAHIAPHAVMICLGYDMPLARMQYTLPIPS